MAIHANSTPALARTLLRSGGAPCRVLTTADVVALATWAPLPSLRDALQRRAGVFGPVEAAPAPARAL